jgi:hypothetical protein
LRLLGLAALMLAAIWFGLVDNDWLDPRPVRRMLFLGHSYTYYNNMPAMVAKMSDSADSPVRYDITMSAFPNATLEDHWHNRKTRQLLSQGGWYRVIAQPEGGLSLRDADSAMFVNGGKLLVGTAEQPPAIVIGWQATEAFCQKHYRMSRSQVAAVEQNNLRGLAIATGADVIDVASAWDRVQAERLPFSLYKDGNHPSLEGSYLAALIIYAGLSHGDVTTVTYVPWGMSNEDAKLLREHVQAALTGH